VRARRLPLILSAFALAGAAAAAFPAGAATSTPAGPVFGHEVVIDHQRSGFEPDIVVTSKNVLYSSVPNGSSQAHSFIWNSLDSGDSWQLIPGQFGVGKPLTCPQGGGDTELQRDAGDNLYLSDLQNLSNLSNAVSTDGGKTFTFSCTSAPNTPVDRMWYASHGKLGDPDFAIYEEYDAVLSNTNPNSPIGNQLVEIVSHDGANFTPVINANPGPDCLGGGVVNCVTNEEGLPGNQILTKKGDLVIAHSGQDGNSVFVSVGHPTTTGTGQAAVTTATWKDVRVNGDICPVKNGNTSGICGSTNFPTIQQDSAGNLYLVNSAQAQKAPYGVYVNVSKDGGNTWGPSVLVSKDGSNAFPWLTAGSEGRVAVAWYHANEEGEKNLYAFDNLAHAEFSVQVAQSIDALAAKPHYNVVTASEHPIKYGPICTAGTTCTVSQGDRSLGDYLNLGVDQDGGLALVYVDDTSNSYTTGPTGAVAENGPPVYQKQIGGPTMIVGKTPHGSLPVNSVSDRSGDSIYSANSQRTPAGDNLDLTGASVTEDAGGLVITMKVKSLESLQINPTAGGTTGTWITRFTTYNPATPGNGHIYYAGMESIAGQSPRFFDGDVAQALENAGAQVQLSMVFDSARAIKGDYKPNGTVTLHVPFADIPGAKSGQRIYSATAFTGSTVGTLSGNPEGVINVLDATAPFNHVMGNAAAPVTPVTPPKSGGQPPASGGGTGAPGGGNLAATGLGLQLPLLGLGLLGLALALRRRRA
jgi:hypothetical protein